MTLICYTRKVLLACLCFSCCLVNATSQNINGEKIVVGKESITIINFPDKVLNINFSDDAAYDYYIPKRREEKSISIQFNKEKPSGPNTGLLVNEGGRSHMFRLLYDSTYDINDDSRPPLWYDHSNLKQLKSFVKNQKDISPATPKGDELAVAKAEQKEAAAVRQEEMKALRKNQEEEAVAKKTALAQQRKNDEASQKLKDAELAKAKKEAAEKEKQLALAAKKEAAEKTAAEEQARKEADAIAQQKLQDEKKQKELKDKKDSEALAKAQKDAAEKQRIQQEQIAKRKQQEEEKRQKAAADLAKKEAEKKAAQERLVKLENERKMKEENKAYSEAGLWQRYGKKGIDLYNFPREQVATVNSDFYVAGDTLRNAHISDSLISGDIPGKLNIAADKPINKNVNITLENISFKDVHTYYKLKIENNTNEDFLMGRTYMYWYDANEKAKMMVKGSYLTYISFFPLVPPHATRYVVFATRSPNVINNESLVLFVDERRKDKGSASIVISGSDYNKELAKVQVGMKEKSPAPKQEKAEKPTKKKSKKRL